MTSCWLAEARRGTEVGIASAQAICSGFFWRCEALVTYLKIKDSPFNLSYHDATPEDTV